MYRDIYEVRAWDLARHYTEASDMPDFIDAIWADAPNRLSEYKKSLSAEREELPLRKLK